MVATGLALAAVAATINSVLDGRLVGDGGWFEYAPNAAVAFDPAPTGPALRRLLVWIVAIAAWVAIGWRLLGLPHTGRNPDPNPGERA